MSGPDDLGQDSAAPIASEQAADLAALQASASLEAPAGPAAAQGPAIEEPSAASLALAKAAISTARPLLSYLFKPLQGSPVELWDALEPGVAGIVEHYGWNQSDLLASPWARLALSALPLAGYCIAHMEEPAKPVERLEGPDLQADAPVASSADPQAKAVTFGAPA